MNERVVQLRGPDVHGLAVEVHADRRPVQRPEHAVCFDRLGRDCRSAVVAVAPDDARLVQCDESPVTAPMSAVIDPMTRGALLRKAPRPPPVPVSSTSGEGSRSDKGRRVESTTPPCNPAMSSQATGSVIFRVVPRPGSVSRDTLPPLRSANA